MNKINYRSEKIINWCNLINGECRHREKCETCPFVTKDCTKCVHWQPASCSNSSCEDQGRFYLKEEADNDS